MNLGFLRKLTRNDFPEAPVWIDKLLVPLNQFMNEVRLILDRRVDFVTNIPAQLISLTITAGAAATNNTASILCTMKTKPFGCFIVQAVQDEAVHTPLTAVAQIGSWYYDAGNIQITSIVGLTSGKKYELTILVI